MTIIICCHNSASRLPRCLEHIAAQPLPPAIPFEIVVVDNASSDGTADTARSEWIRLGNVTTLKVVYEPKPGLAFARHAGVKASAYDVVIFCDDDNFLAPNYLRIAHELMTNKPDVAIAGGVSNGQTEGVFPEWFEEYERFYAVGRQGERSGDVSEQKSIWGAGMILRREFFTKLYHVSPPLLVDRKGNELSSGGDSEFCMRALLAGYKLYFDDRLQFVHFIASDRLTIDYRRRLMDGMEMAFKVLNIYAIEVDGHRLPLAKKILTGCQCLVRYVGATYFGMARWNPRYQAQVLFHLFGLRLIPVGEVSEGVKTVARKIKKLRL